MKPTSGGLIPFVVYFNPRKHGKALAYLNSLPEGERTGEIRRRFCASLDGAGAAIDAQPVVVPVVRKPSSLSPLAGQQNDIRGKLKAQFGDDL